jgi:hypothetical protein
MGSGAGSAESSPESDDADGKNKSLWEKVKNFCYNHRTEIAIGVLVIISIILYGQYKKPPTPPTLPTGDKPTPPGPPPPQELSQQILPFALDDSQNIIYKNVYDRLFTYVNGLPHGMGIFSYHSIRVSKEDFLVFARTAHALRVYIDKLFNLEDLDPCLTIPKKDRLQLVWDRNSLDVIVPNLELAVEDKHTLSVSTIIDHINSTVNIEKRANKTALFLLQEARSHSI